jgi:hypothetical protein
MRSLNISGPGVATDEEFCPHGQVRLEERDGYQVCRLCRSDIRQLTGQRRVRLRRRSGGHTCCPLGRLRPSGLSGGEALMQPRFSH